jgi:hypothetical protein
MIVSRPRQNRWPIGDLNRCGETGGGKQAPHRPRPLLASSGRNNTKAGGENAKTFHKTRGQRSEVRNRREFRIADLRFGNDSNQAKNRETATGSGQNDRRPSFS